jgi:uncharacterized protein YecE (DUF72 family)
VPARVGPAGWSYADWAGRVYPAVRPRGFSELGRISALFDAVEINSSFYRPPSAAMAEGWLRQAPHGFLFTAKIWRRFTHEAAEFSVEEVRPFREGVAPLRRAGALGALLAQFPWSFRDTPENRRRIRAIRDAFEGDPLVVEVRHASWNNPDALDFLRAMDAGFCNIDQPASREGITGTRHATSARVAYVRLHGRNRESWFDPRAGRDDKYNYLYSEAELAEWIDAVRVLERRAATVFVIANNHFGGQAVANALELKAALTGTKADVPVELLRAFPRLSRIALDPGPPLQRGLFGPE